MSTLLLPFGLRAVENAVGLARPQNFYATSYVNGVVQKNYSTTATFGSNQPVSISSGGQIAPAPSAASANLPIWGVFVGCQYVDTSGRTVESQVFQDGFQSSAVGVDPKVTFWYLPVTETTEFEIQAEGSIASTQVDALYDFSVTSPRRPQDVTTIGSESAYGTVAMQAAEVGAGAIGSLRVIGLGRQVAYPAGTVANYWSDAFTIVRVVVANNAAAATRVNLT